jgi:diadenosine tetraphosphate (Ap4A) HIT family hydrolase
MMIASRAHRAGAHELDAAEQAELGAVVAAVARAVRAETACDRTYTISFNEAVPHLHVHVIPRHASDPSTTSWALADRYRATARREVEGATASDAERLAVAIAARAARELEHLGFATTALGA